MEKITIGVVAVSLVVHRTPAAELGRALECVLRCPDVTRVAIIDNSPDDRLSLFGDFDRRVSYQHVANNGFGAGHNIALRDSIATGAEFHLVMNADVMWEGDILSPIVKYMRENPDVGLLSPKVYYPDGDLQYACRMLPTPFDLFAKRFLPASLTQKRMRRYLLAEANHDKEFNCPYLLGSFLFFRMEALRKSGLFDERFFMYPEDIDITRRLHEHWRTMFWPGVSIIHAHAAASRKSLRMLRIHITNMFRYFNKWGWFRDPLRKKYNRTLLASMPRVKGTPPAGRG